MENKGNHNNNNQGGNNNGGNNKNGMTIMIFILAALLVLFLTSLLNSCAKDATNKEITYSEFIEMVEQDKVESVTFTSNRINITPKGENKLYRITYYTAELNDESLLPLLKEHDVKFGGTVEDVSSAIMWNMVSYILPLVLVWVLLYFLIFRKMGSGGMMGVGKTTAKVYVEKSTGVTFKDVAGQDEAKESLQEVVDFLHNPKKYTDIGAKLPKGALLVGPPGTGKTLLAKAVAGEAKVPFFSLAGSDFVEMFVGVGASRVRDLFKEAQKQAPCIIFIDEIDAIGKSRDTRYGGNDEREQTLNQLLAEMDGFDTSKGLLILAATNRPEVLDKALLRPGRFDRRIIVDKPDLKGRVETLKVHAKNVLLDDSVDLDAIALATSGAVGSDLANMINEAAINAVKHGRRHVNQSDLFESVEVVIAGKEKKDRIMGPKEKKMVAYHEVGHALVTALQKDAEPVQKITIVPRTMGALGYTMQVPEEEKFLMTKNELIAHLVTYMGGRAAEEIVFDSVTTGASNDIEQATKIARSMVTQYGMSEKFGLMGLVTIENQYLDGRASLNCGEETAAQIDQEVMRILKESYDEAVRLLQENRSILDEIAQYLYEHETITGKEFMKIFRELKGIPEPEEKTDAEKAAEGFKAEEIYHREFQEKEKKTAELQKPSEKEEPPVFEVNTLDFEVNTLAEDPIFEVNTLEGKEIPKELNQELHELEEKENQISSANVSDTAGQMKKAQEEMEPRELEKEIEIIPIIVNGKKESEEAIEEETGEEKELKQVSDKKEAEKITVETVIPEKPKPEQISEKPAAEEKKPEQISEKPAAEEKKPEQILEKSVLQERKEPKQILVQEEPEPKEEKIATPEELGFFPVKKGASKKKSVSVKAGLPKKEELQPEKTGAEKQAELKSEDVQKKVLDTEAEKARPEKASEEPVSAEGEDYLDKLLKGLK
ncbi:MAG: ATP-dependent zinc metalloprotease FtsH [Lachnospiraceae bacterium]|nr:ATP-dependent zinc metalloprotease FtsH [Lachnospiraceae bacterium]